MSRAEIENLLALAEKAKDATAHGEWRLGRSTDDVSAFIDACSPATISSLCRSLIAAQHNERYHGLRADAAEAREAVLRKALGELLKRIDEEADSIVRAWEASDHPMHPDASNHLHAYRTLAGRREYHAAIAALASAGSEAADVLMWACALRDQVGGVEPPWASSLSNTITVDLIAAVDAYRAAHKERT